MAQGNRQKTNRRGKAGMPKTGGIRTGDIMGSNKGKRLNTHDIIKGLRSDVRKLERKHFGLLEKAFEMIGDGKTQDFVKKDLILGLLQIITPKMKAVEMNIEAPPTQILFQTNVGPQRVDGDSTDQLPRIEDMPAISSKRQ